MGEIGNPSRGKIPNRGVLIVVACFIVTACLTYRYIRLESEDREIQRIAKTISSLTLACRSYAADWEGAYPPNLEALYPAYVDLEDLFYATNKSGEKTPLIYHSGLDDTSYSQSILIKYPFPIRGKRIVAFAGGHVAFTRE